MVHKKCVHNRRAYYCKEDGCGGQGICIHDMRKERCFDCGGSALCEHKIQRYRCVKCNGSSICVHNKRKDRCEECILLLMCEHNNRKATCEICKEELKCEHQKTREKCNICNPTYLKCEHGITKYMCKPCNGSAWCPHDKYKSRCKDCNGSGLCKSPLCETVVSNPKYEGYCLRCFIHLFPDKPNSRNYKTKEKNVVDYIITYFPDFSWVADKKIQDGCSRRRPDLLLDLGTHIIIVEVDENQHEDYDCSCENRRLMELSQDVGHRPIVFIRFNPDDYIDHNGEEIETCWKINGLGVCIIKNEKKWEERIKNLKTQIQYWIENPTDKTIEIVELYYDYYYTK
jgi:hypothetical protein